MAIVHFAQNAKQQLLYLQSLPPCFALIAVITGYSIDQHDLLYYTISAYQLFITQNSLLELTFMISFHDTPMLESKRDPGFR